MLCRHARPPPDLAGEELETALSGLDLDQLPAMYGGRLPNDQAPSEVPRRSHGPAKVSEPRTRAARWLRLCLGVHVLIWGRDR